MRGTRKLSTWMDRGGPAHPELERYRTWLMDGIFRPFMVAGFIAVALGSWRAIGDGQPAFAALYIALYVGGISSAFAFRRWKTRARALMLIVALLVLSLTALLRLGLGGVGTLTLTAAAGLCAILLGARAALWTVAAGVVMFAGVGWAMVSGAMVLAPERAAVSTAPGAWVVSAFTFAAVMVGLIVPLQSLSVRFAKTLEDLERQRRQAERSNEELRAEGTRRQEAEAARQAGEVRYRRIFESASVGIIEEDLSEVRAHLAALRDQGVVDMRAHLESHPEVVVEAARKVRILDANQAAFGTYGATSKSELFDSLDRIFAPDSIDSFREVLVAIAEGRSRFRGEVVNRTLAGDRIHVLLQASIPEDPAASVLVSVLDITERKELEQSLAEAQKMQAIGTLAGGIAHDFNNLLMGIRGYATLLARRAATTGDHSAYLESIDQLVDSGAALTRQLLGFASGGKYDLRPTDLRSLLDDSLSIFARAKKEIVTRAELAGDLWTVEADQAQIEQVMLNLYVNGWQAMPEGGQLELEASNVTLDAAAAEPRSLEPGDYVRISVKDSGIGMDEATAARVFEPFFTTKELGRGTGLGLASVYAIVRNHGGAVEVESAPGRGTTFVVFLPASTKPVAGAAAEKRAIRRGSELVLLVDDEPAIRRSTGLMLEELGYRVLTARNGSEALRHFEEHGSEVCAVVLDMIMPGLGGAATFERLRSRNHELPVLLSSGYSQDEQAEQLLQQGPTAFLQKPFRIEALSERLRELIERGAGRSGPPTNRDGSDRSARG